MTQYNKNIGMNFKMEHMIHKLFITALILSLLPVAAVGQQLKKEFLKGTNSANPGSDYAVFYSSGIPESAIWPLGMKLSRNGATIRHTESKGNGTNTSVNDKVPFRFIIAPTEESGKYWAAAMGFHSGTEGDNMNLDPDGTFASGFSGGCKNYSTTEFPKGSWRLPTQRELMLMWLFREGINTIYASPPASKLTENKYWSATEQATNKAWYMDFNATTPQSGFISKTTAMYFRCVRDF